MSLTCLEPECPNPMYGPTLHIQKRKSKKKENYEVAPPCIPKNQGHYAAVRLTD